MLVNKNVFVLKEVTGKEGVLECIYVDKEHSYATDGRILLRIKNPKDSEEDFPAVYSGQEPKEGFLLTSQTIEKIKKNLPKSPSFPILNDVCIKEDNEMLKCFVTDLDNTIEIKQTKVKERYPEVKKFFEEKKEAKITVRLNVKLLKKLVKVVSEYMDEDHLGIDFSFYGEDDPVKVRYYNPNRIVELEGIIMPMKK